MQSLCTIFIGIFLVLGASTITWSQTESFEITLEPITITDLGGLQSYAFGQSAGKWLIVGGRLDGLHRRQPWAAFDLAGHNNQLLVVDPISQEKWSAPLTSLPSSIQEQLSSTNMEFYQEDDYLYCVGGYGYSATEGDHTTFDKLTAIHIDQVINAVIEGEDFNSFFRQISDSDFQVTGGHIEKINDTYYLLGGQKFIGRYNPMGPDFGPGFIQEYTNAVRKFNLTDDGTDILISHLPAIEDEENLHRRDYNAVAEILANGDQGITMFSGVFEPVTDLPFLNCVNVTAEGYEVDNEFQQYYNHYHCPVLPLFSESSDEMHTIFFGGIAQFYDNDGELVQDNNVPFVNTIAQVTRDANGVRLESKLAVEMPALLGAGAEFIPNLEFPQFGNGVFKSDSLTADSVLIGHIYGGISSTQSNIFFINDGTQSSASDVIYRVYIKKTTVVDVPELETGQPLNVVVYPNPSQGKVNVSLNLAQRSDVLITIRDSKSSLVSESFLSDVNAGKSNHVIELASELNQGILYMTIETSEGVETRKLILEDD